MYILPSRPDFFESPFIELLVEKSWVMMKWGKNLSTGGLSGDLRVVSALEWTS